MKDKTLLIPIATFVAVVWFCIAMIVGFLDPNSIFCVNKIYKQPDGTYQVWYSGKYSNTLKLSGATYDQAKAFQIKECRELREFISQRPRGERVK
jgi:hypothetical protein